MALHCQVCGTRLCEGGKYCHNCGEKVISSQNGLTENALAAVETRPASSNDDWSWLGNKQNREQKEEVNSKAKQHLQDQKTRRREEIAGRFGKMPGLKRDDRHRLRWQDLERRRREDRDRHFRERRGLNRGFHGQSPLAGTMVTGRTCKKQAVKLPCIHDDQSLENNQMLKEENLLLKAKLKELEKKSQAITRVLQSAVKTEAEKRQKLTDELQKRDYTQYNMNQQLDLLRIRLHSTKHESQEIDWSPDHSQENKTDNQPLFIDITNEGFTEGKIAGQEVQFLVDTGAFVSVIDVQFVKNFGQFPLETSDPNVSSLLTVSGEKMPVLGKTFLSIHLNGCEYSCKFHVVKKLACQNAILGRDFLQENRARIAFKGTGRHIEKCDRMTTVAVMGTLFAQQKEVKESKAVSTDVGGTKDVIKIPLEETEVDRGYQTREADPSSVDNINKPMLGELSLDSVMYALRKLHEGKTEKCEVNAAICIDLSEKETVLLRNQHNKNQQFTMQMRARAFITEFRRLLCRRHDVNELDPAPVHPPKVWRIKCQLILPEGKTSEKDAVELISRDTQRQLFLIETTCDRLLDLKILDDELKLSEIAFAKEPGESVQIHRMTDRTLPKIATAGPQIFNLRVAAPETAVTNLFGDREELLSLFCLPGDTMVVTSLDVDN